MQKELAPILIFTYSRPEHTKNTIEALSNNVYAKDSEVWIFSDNAKNEKSLDNVKKVREYINTVPKKKYFKKVTIIEADKNKGLANSIISGVTDIINKYEKVIVLEDDLITTEYFIKYMNECLDFYKENNSIWSISGYNLPINIPNTYNHDIYMSYRGCSWGWATWKDRWETVDWNMTDYNKLKNNYFMRKSFNKGGNDMSLMLDDQMNNRIDSWAIRWCYSQSKQYKFTVYPVISLIQNNGLDGTGTHSGTTNDFDVQIEKKDDYKLENLEINPVIVKNFKNKFYYGIKQSIRELLVIIGLDKQVNKYINRKRK
ncbi:MAG: glycosyltransferase [Bacilli bacterium]|nr:glycosyltransferase [Bacilli bacterium]